MIINTTSGLMKHAQMFASSLGRNQVLPISVAMVRCDNIRTLHRGNIIRELAPRAADRRAGDELTHACDEVAYAQRSWHLPAARHVPARTQGQQQLHW